VDAANGWRPAPGFIGGAACLVDNFAANKVLFSSPQNKKFFKIFRYIEFYDICMKH
jgi:hypothetical protein